jgi:hypothetical protein
METNPPEHLRLRVKEPVRLPDEKPPVVSDPRYCFFDESPEAIEEEQLRRQSYYREGYTSRGFREMMGRLGVRVGLVFAGIYAGALLGAVLSGALANGLDLSVVFSFQTLQMLLVYPFMACLRPLIFLMTTISAVWIYVNDNEDFEWADYRLPLTLLIITHAFAGATMM